MANASDPNDMLQGIWENWQRHEGPCQACPVWGGRGGSRPFFGVGDLSANVALVAEEPGTGGKPPNPALDESSEESISEYLNEAYPGSFDDVRRDLADTGMYQEHSPHLRDCIDVLESRGHDLYYTNVKKCCESNNGDFEEAVKQCSQYLGSELASVNPKVIVAFGNTAMKTVYEEYEVKEDQSEVTSKITDEALKIRTTAEIAIIPSVHFSSAHFHQNIPAEMDSEEYWETLSNRIDEVIH